jgi:hypothetical protein
MSTVKSSFVTGLLKTDFMAEVGEVRQISSGYRSKFMVYYDWISNPIRGFPIGHCRRSARKYKEKLCIKY